MKSRKEGEEKQSCGLGDNKKQTNKKKTYWGGIMRKLLKVKRKAKVWGRPKAMGEKFHQKKQQPEGSHGGNEKTFVELKAFGLRCFDKH